jgi:hypothetical protein
MIFSAYRYFHRVFGYPTIQIHMFEELMNVVRQFGHSEVVENPAIPNQHNEAVMQEAGSTIFSSLKNYANSGDTDAVSGLLNGEENHPATVQVKNNFADNIIQKFGIGRGAAQGLAASLIPMVLRSLLKRPGNPTNASAMSLPGLLSSLTGGNQNGGMLSGLGAKLGLDKDGDGDVDMADLSRLVHR